VFFDWMDQDGRSSYTKKINGKNQTFHINITHLDLYPDSIVAQAQLKHILNTWKNTYFLTSATATFGNELETFLRSGIDPMFIVPENGHSLIFKDTSYGLSMATAHYRYAIYFFLSLILFSGACMLFLEN